MPDLVHDPGGAHLKPRYRTLLGLGLAATVALTLPAFLYAALALARVLGIDAHAPLWRQRRSDLGFFLVIVTAMIWIAACFVVYKAILVAVLRRKGVLTPDVGWFSALGSRFPAPWLDNERRQSGSLWTPWGWERVRLGPQFATALVFF